MLLILLSLQTVKRLGGYDDELLKNIDKKIVTLLDSTIKSKYSTEKYEITGVQRQIVAGTNFMFQISFVDQKGENKKAEIVIWQKLNSELKLTKANILE
ncbi:Cystatin_domain [Hexamita inflata]|uniref:Cystatin domain n=1 Tax=Hexamita inflata TaxID=28002 RepID=A0AA86TT86_9EUKA|nr:Cystatin domain [Hexamita inflata]